MSGLNIQELIASGKYERSGKLFITNLSPDISDEKLKQELQPLFKKYGDISTINVKKHKSGQYSYSFLEYERVEDAIRAIQEMDQKIVLDRPMKVRQDRQGDGCFNCKKTGHFAKQCPQRQGGSSGNQNNRDHHRRDYRRRSPNNRDRNDDYGSYRNKRQRDDRRSRSRSYDYRDKNERRHRKSRSRSRQHSPRNDYRRRDSRRQNDRYRRSRSRSGRSRSGSYENRGYRRNEYERGQKRSNNRDRQYRRRSPSSSSYEKRR